MIGLVTVLYKGDDMLEDFFKSLGNQSWRSYHLFIVDNSPSERTDRLIAQLQAQYKVPELTHIKNEANFGVAKGNNIGIAASRAKGYSHTLLLNNDIEFDDAELLRKIFETAVSKEEKLLVPKIYFYDSNKIWMAGGKFHHRRAVTEHFGSHQEDSTIYNIAKHVDYAPTCFMLISNDIFDRVGTMREQYFVYYDDTDFIYRAVKAGFRILYMPSVSIRHKESVSTGGMASPFSIFFMNRNRTLFVRFNYRGLSYWRAMGYILYDGIRIGIKDYNRTQRWALLKGVWNGLTKLDRGV